MTRKGPPASSIATQPTSQQVPFNGNQSSYVSEKPFTSTVRSNSFRKFFSNRAVPSLMNRHKNWVRQKRKSLTNLLHISLRPAQSTDQTDYEIPPLGERTNSTSQSAASKDFGMENDAGSQQDGCQIAPKTTFTVRGNRFNLNSRYSYVKSLGFGAYGVVCAAVDTTTKRRVAVKKVSNVFEDLTDAKRILREIRLLRSMNHDNVLKIIDIDDPADYDTFNDVYIVTELMDTDLGKLLRSSAKLLDSQRKFFVYHMLRALQYIHSANIMHRDLKPANVLVSESVSANFPSLFLPPYCLPRLM